MGGIKRSCCWFSRSIMMRRLAVVGGVIVLVFRGLQSIAISLDGDERTSWFTPDAAALVSPTTQQPAETSNRPQKPLERDVFPFMIKENINKKEDANVKNDDDDDDDDEDRPALSSSPPDIYVFPRWNETTGISLPDLLEFISGVQNGTASIKPNAAAERRYVYPETPYIMDRQGVFVSEKIRSRTWKQMLRERVEPTEGLLQLARQRIILDEEKQQNNNNNNNNNKWPRLYKAIMEGEGFPMVLWYGDYKQCGKHNVRHAPDFSRTKPISVPVFTMCAPVDCHYAFPLPTYQTIRDSLPSSSAWDARRGFFEEESSSFQNNEHKTTFGSSRKSKKKKKKESKIPKSVWRGSLSNDLGPDGDYRQMPRWRLAQLGHDHDQESLVVNDSGGAGATAAAAAESVLDVGLVSIPSKHRGRGYNRTLIGGLKKPIQPMTEFQRYMGIIDIDGNSWSSRFGSILCYDSSVVLKVEPDYVDLFMRDLVPGKHHISIQKDLSDLIPKARWLVDPNNSESVRSIQEQAHQYCRDHMVWSRLAEDVLDVLEEYVRYMEIGDPHWQDQWKPAKQELMKEQNLLGLREVTKRLEEL